MEEYKSNSHKSREAEKTKLEKVVSGKVTTKKKSGARKLADIFIAGDVKSVTSNIIADTIIPGITNMICEALKDGVDMMFRGEKSRGTRNSTTYHVSYKNNESARREYPIRSPLEFDDIVLQNKSDAEAVLDAMYDILNMYEQVRVTDLYELVGKTGRYTDNAYGWRSLRGSDIVKVYDGWLLRLPKVVPLRG